MKGVLNMKKMMFVLLALSTLATTANAVETKIGYVDIKAAMESTKDYSQGLKRLEALESKKTKQLEAMRNRITDLEKEVQMQSMTMSNDHKMAKQQEMTQLKKEFDRELQDASDKFYDAVREYGKTNNFDIILPKSATVYASGKNDITADITKILDTK